MSLAQPFICLIDGVDYGPAGNGAVSRVAGDAAGVDKIGACTIELNFPASAGYTFTPTREVQIYTETYTGSTHTGNNPLFGGFIKHEGITVHQSPDGHTWVTLECEDYNCLFDYIIPDLVLAGAGASFTLGADTFANQVKDLCKQFQWNSHGTVAKLIDATHDVIDLGAGHVFAIQHIPSGISLRAGLRILIANVVAFNSALRPRTMLELVDNVSVPAQVICGLVVYDSANLPSPSYTFSETPTGGQKAMLTPHTRTFDAALPLGNYVQSLWHVGGAQWNKVKTSEGTTSEATYYNPYLNGALTGNVGPWKLPVIKDSSSTNDAQAQTAADLVRYAHEFPRETLAIDEDGTYVQQGQTVTIITTNINAVYEVTAVKFSFPSLADPTYVRYNLTCGLPLLELFNDSGVEWTKAPQIQDVVPPNPPGTPSVTANTFNPITGLTDVSLSYAASSSDDTRGYYIVWRHNGLPSQFDVENTTTPTISLPPGQSGTIDVYAYDGATPPNVSTSGGQINVTTSLGTQTLINPGFDQADPADSTLPFAWTRTVANGGLARRGTPLFGAASGEITTNGSAGCSAQLESTYLTDAPWRVAFLNFYAEANFSSTQFFSTLTFLASDGVTVLGTSTMTWIVGVSVTRLSVAAAVPVGTFYYKVKFLNNNATARQVLIDAVQVGSQSPGAGIEDGAISQKKTAFNPTTGDELHLLDESGVPVYDIYWSSGARKYIIAPRADDATYPSPGIQIKGGTVTPAWVDITDAGVHIEGALSMTSSFVQTAKWGTD